MSWYQEAQKSDSSKVKELLKAYKEEQDKTQKQALKEAIVLVLGIKDTEDEPKNPFMVDNEKEDENKKNKSFSFPKSQEEILKINDLETLEKIFHESKTKGIKLEKTRLKHETFKERIALNKKIWAIRRIGFMAHHKANEIKLYLKRKENASKVNMMHKKRQIFINFIKQGYSFSRICEIEGGLNKEEIREIVDNDTMEACKPYMKNICAKFAKWCEMNFKEEK